VKNSIGQRLKIFIESKKISQEELAEIIKVPKQQISSWTTGVTNITTKYIPDLLNAFPDMDARWLLTGSKSLIENNNIAEEPPPPNYGSDCSNPICIEKIRSLTLLVEELKEYKDTLNRHVEFLHDRLRKEDPGEKKIAGGVAQTRKTG